MVRYGKSIKDMKISVWINGKSVIELKEFEGIDISIAIPLALIKGKNIIIVKIFNVNHWMNRFLIGNVRGIPIKGIHLKLPK